MIKKENDKRRNPEKARQICEMYHNGLTMSSIARIMNCKTNLIVQYLNGYYSYFYGNKWLRKRQSYNDRELFIKYRAEYVPGIYTRKELCEKIGCTIREFEHMCKTYNINHLRLHTYKNQKTLCNVPEEIFNDVKLFAQKHNMSIRKLAMLAINEYILREGLK